MSTAEERLAELKGKRDSLDVRIDMHEIDVVKAQEAADKAEADLAEAREDLDSLREELEDLKALIEDAELEDLVPKLQAVVSGIRFRAHACFTGWSGPEAVERMCDELAQALGRI